MREIFKNKGIKWVNTYKEIIELINKGNSYYKTTTILKEKYPDTKIKSDTLKSRYLKWINEEN